MNDWVVETPTFEEDLMNNRVVMLNQNGVNRVVEMIKEKEKEIESLSNRFYKIKEYLKQVDYEQQHGILSSHNLIWTNIERLCEGKDLIRGGKK